MALDVTGAAIIGHTNNVVLLDPVALASAFLLLDWSWGIPGVYKHVQDSSSATSTASYNSPINVSGRVSIYFFYTLLSFSRIYLRYS